MRKILFVLMLCLCTFSIQETCHATNWIWLSSNDKFNMYYDSDSCELNNKEPYVKFWLKQTDLNNEVRLTENLVEHGRYYITYLVEYDPDGNIINDCQVNISRRLIPGSNMYNWTKIVIMYCQKNHPVSKKS